MSIDYAEVERQFLATLEEDTGRTLAAWMGVIDAQGLAHRNDIIDWLRRQGFMFSKASWLERIHNNGGRPIYEGETGARPRAPARPRTMRPAVVAPPPKADEAPSPSPAPAAPPPPQPAPAPVAASPQPSDTAALDALVARAKAFRPLALYVIAEIRKAVPGVVATPHDGYVVFRTTADFAVLAVSPKELRLGLAAKEAPGAPWEASKLALRAAPPTTHTVTLTDARQITPAFMATVARAASP